MNWLTKTILAGSVWFFSLAAAGGKLDDPLLRSIQRMNIAGVYWGQEAGETELALSQRGFEITGRSTGPNFEDRVRIEVARSRGESYEPTGHEVLSRIEAWKGREHVQIFLVAHPSGARVSEMSYGNPAYNAKEIERVARERYSAAGLIPVEGMLGLRFCAPEDAACIDNREPDLPSIKTNFSNLTLVPGRLGEETFNEPFNRAAKAAAGDLRPSF